MPAEITGWFSDIDEAEHAAREMRRLGKGIRSLKIRQPKERRKESNFLPMMAYYGSEPLNGSNYQPVGYLAGTKNVSEDARLDGPLSRKDCFMVMVCEDSTASSNASLMRALHGSHINMIPHLPKSPRKPIQ